MSRFIAIFLCLLSFASAFAAPNVFSVSPYVQHPGTNAMSILFFTTANVKATVKVWPAGGSESAAIVRTTTPTDVSGVLGKNPKNSDTLTYATQYRHAVRFTDLKLHADYCYSVTPEGGATYCNVFRTLPDKNTPVRFIGYCDCETTPKGAAADWSNNGGKTKYFVGLTEGFASNLVHIAARKPDLITISGDLAAQGGYQKNWDEFWRQNAGVNAKGDGYNDIAGSIPILAAIGNHDLKDGSSTVDSSLGGEFALEKYLTYFEYNPNGVKYEYKDGTNEEEDRDLGRLFHRTDLGPVTLIFLDTNKGAKGYGPDSTQDYADRPAMRAPDFHPGSLQYTWLTNNLADAQRNSKFTFVINHHCPYSVGQHNRPSDGGCYDGYNTGKGCDGESAQAVRCLTETMIRYGVDAWLCGHDEIQEHSQLSGRETLPDGTTRDHTLNVYDLGSGGDGLRGTKLVDNPYEVFRAFADSGEKWEDGVLVDGGCHYGFMEVDVTTNRLGKWTCSLTPCYDFIYKDKSGKVAGFELRRYKDRVIIDRSSNEIVYQETKNAPVGTGVPADYVEYERPPEGPGDALLPDDPDDPGDPDDPPAVASDSFAVNPYLQRPASDAMSILFFTKAASVATVTCRRHDGEGETLTETTTGVWAEALTNNLVCGDTARANDRLYRHNVRFTGLKPNRIYDYTVTLGGGTSYSNTFRTAPDRNTPIRFVAYADSETESDPWANYVKNLAQMKAREPDFVAIPGDLVARGGIQSYWDGFWRANAGDKGTIASSIPLLTVLGNHDLYDNGVRGDKADDYKYDLQGETGTDRYLAYFENEPNGVEYTVRDGTDIPETRDLSQLFHRVDYGPVTLIFLDTNDGDDNDHSRDTNYETRSDANRCRPGIDRSLGGRHPDFNPGTPQYTWLTNQLADAQQKSRFTFVFNHHCPYSIGSHNQSPTSGKTGGSAQPVRILTETLVRYGVDGWICGHDEILEHSITNGYEVLPDGSKRKHTLSIYDLGCSGDTFRQSNECKNPLEYFKVTTSNYGFLEVDVNTNKSGRWTCSLTPIDVSGGTYRAQKDQIILEEESGDIVYREHGNETRPADWVPWTKPPEGLAWDESVEVSLTEVTAADLTYNGAEQRPRLTVKAGELIVPGDYYTASTSPSPVKDAGSYSVTVTGAGNVKGTATAFFEVNPAPESAFVDGEDAEITVDGETTVDVGEAAIKVGAMRIRGTGDLTISNYQNLTPSSVDLSGLSGTVTYECVSSSANKSLPSGLDTTIRNTTDQKVKYAFRGTTAANGWNLGSWTSTANFPVKTHLILDEGTHKWEVDNSGTSQKFGENGTDGNPTLLVKQGATLTMSVHDFSGYQGAYAEGGVVRVNDGGTLNFTVRTSGSYFDFNYRQRLYLEPGSLMTFSYPSSSSRKFALHGGVSTDPAKMQIYVPASETDRTAKPAVIRQESGSCALMTHGNSSNRHPGFAAFVGANSKLRIEADLTVGEGSATDDSKLAKYGAGELEITGTVTSIGIDAAEGVITLPAGGGKFNGRFYKATADVTYRFPSGWASGAAYTLGSGTVTGTAPAANAATVYVGDGKLAGATLAYSGKTVKYEEPERPRFAVTPYLQHPAPTEMTIRFFTAQPYAATVTCDGRTYGVSCEEATDLVKVASDDQMVWGEKYYKYSIRLTGLSPNTDYPYEVALADGETYSNVFRTAPDDLDTPVRFVAYSDSECIPTSYAAEKDNSADSKGCTTEWDVLVDGQNQVKTYYAPRSDGFAANLGYMAAWKPNLYVVAGDLVARGGVQMFWDEYWKEMAGGLGRGYGDPAGAAPILAVMGNHDHYDNKGSSALNYNTSSSEYGLKKFLTYFEFNPNGVDYASSSTERDSRDKSQLFHRMDYGPVTLLFLDTNKGGSAHSDSRAPSFTKGSLQYQWIEANLKDARDVRKSRFIFVVNHQCPYSRGKHNSPSDGQSAANVRTELTPLLLEYHVTAWLGGHDEMQEHAQVRGDDGYVLNVYDLGSGGDGLKGRHIYTDNDKYMVFSAYDDSPDGTHYGHLRVEAKPVDGTWYCSIVPAYSYFANATSPSELRFYKDKVVIAEDGEIVYQERLGAAGGVDPTDPSYRPPSGTPAGLSPSGTVELLTDRQKEYLAKSVEERRAAAADANDAFDALFCYGSPVTLSWTGTEGACRVKVTRCSDDKIVFAATVYGNEATVCNLELDAEYEWTVTSGNSDRTASARFRTSDAPPRLIKSGRMKMLRDLGGWTGLQGCRIRQNLLFRGAAADVPGTGEYLIDSDADRDFFWTVVGLRNEVDLRNINSTSDVASSSKKSGLYKFDPEGQHVTYNNFSIENNVIPTSGNLVSALRLLTNPGKLPAYFHCKSGRDRTGTCAAILLAVLGVSRDDILRDYQTTSDKDNLERTEYNGGFLNFLDVRLARYKDAGVSLAENAAAYLKDCGFSEDEIETFREKLLVGYLRPGSAIVSVQPSVTLVYGQKLADVADKVTGTMTTAVGTVVTGTYVFTNGNKAPSVAESGDYEATFRPSTTDALPTAVKVSVTVEPAKLTSASAPSQTYDATVKTPVVTAKAGNLTVPRGSYEITAWDTPPVNAGTHKATVRGIGNFDGEVLLEFTIDPRPVTVEANPLSKEYGAPDPALTATARGLVDGESAEELIKYDVSREAGEGYGTYLITPSGDAVQGNYAVTYRTAHFTITKAQAHPEDKLTASIVYGQRLGAMTEVVGKMTDRTGKEIGGTFAFADSSLLPSVAQSGEYSATFKPEDDVNYGPSEVKVLVTVMPRELIVKAADAAITYGERLPDFSCVYSGFVNNENSSVVSGTCRYSCDYQLNGDVGKYDITVASVEGLSAANYRLTPSAEKGTLTVSPKPVIVTAAPNQGKVYGEEDPALAAVITDASGKALADDLVKYDPLSRTAGENAGTYAIIVSGEENQGNYRVTFKNGTFTVNKATIKSATAEPMPYTGSTLVPAIIVTTADGIEIPANEDCTVGNWRKSGSTWDTATLQAVGTYTATVSAKSGGNLTGSATVSFTITKADYDMGGVAFADKTYTYDGKAKTVTVAGTLPSGIRASYTNNSRTDAGAQTATVTFSGADGNHNNPSAMTATLTVDPATLTSASAASQVFAGRALTPVVTARAGTLEAETIDVTGWDGNLTDVGTYHGKVTGTGNFTGTVDVAFAVIRAKAVVKADDKSKGYGEDDPAFTATVTGTIGSDQLTYSFDREQGDDFGSYAITPKGAAEQGNYSVSYQPGTLTITKAVPKPDGAITATIEYGTKLAAATVSGKMKHKGEVKGAFTFLQPENMPTVQESGRQYEAIFTANDADNYSPAPVMVTVTVNRRPLTVRAANASVTYGTEKPSYAYQLSNFATGENQEKAGVTGSPTYSSAYTKATSVGECKFSVGTAGTLAADNYSFVVDPTPATLKVMPRTVTVTSLPAEKIYGEIDPKFTAKVTGMADGESEDLIHYELSREEGDDVKAGGYQIMPTGETEQGNYTVQFMAEGVLTVKPATITSATAEPMPWTGSTMSPVIVVKAGDLDVPVTTGYTLGNWKKSGGYGYGSATLRDVATYTATVTGTGNFTGTANLTFEIVKADYDMSGVSFESATVTYDGRQHSLAATDLPSGVTVASYSAQNLVNAGIYEITVTFGNGDTTHYNTPANRTAKLTILPATLTSATAANKAYAGKALTPVVTAKAGSLDVGNSFTVGAWDGNLTDAKTYHATVTGTGNFAGTVPVEFTIDPAGIKEATAADQTYDGEKKTPVLTVGAGDLTLGPSDYDLSAWSGGLVAAGTYTATVTGKGNYTGEAGVTFTIRKSTYDMSGVTLADVTVTYDRKPHELLIAGDLPTGVTVTYVGNGQTEVGEFTVTAKFTGDADNYELIADKMAKLTINKAEITSATAAAVTYTGQSQSPKLTVTATGDLALSATEYSLSSWQGDLTNAGSCSTTVTGTGNFTGSTLVTFTISKAPLTVKADDQGVEKGATPPEFTVTYSGFVNGEGEDVLDGELKFSCSYVTTAPAGATFAITPGGLTADNYDIAFQDGTLEVGKSTPKLESLTAEPITYGKTLAASKLTGAAKDGVKGAFDWASDAIRATRPTVAESGRAYDVTFTPEDADNYTVAHFKATVEVKPEELTVRAADTNVTYGAVAPDYACTITGFVDGEDEGVVTGARKLTCPYKPFDNAGTYAITPDLSTFDADNYTFRAVPGALTVDKATLAVSAKDLEITYWDVPPAYAATYSDFLGTDTVSVVTGEAKFDCAYERGSAVGGYSISVSDVSGLSSLNYDFVASETPGTLTVGRKSVTVAADNLTKAYGEADPEPLPATVTGTVGVMSVVYEVTRAIGENVGTYEITARGEKDQGNYEVTYKSGRMTIAKAALVGEDLQATITYGQLLGEAKLTGTVKSLANSQPVKGTFTFVDPKSMLVVADSGKTYNAIFTPDDTKSYETVTLPVFVTVERTILTVKAEDESITYGDEPPAAYVRKITGFVNGEDESVVRGDCKYAPAYAQYGDVGNYPIDIDISQLAADNYDFVAADPAGRLTVNPRPVTITAKDATKTYGESDPAFELLAVEGTVNGDTLTNGFVRAEGDDVREGGYEIRPTGDAVQGNYAVTYVPATLTINPAKITKAWTTPMTYTGSVLAPSVAVKAGEWDVGTSWEYVQPWDGNMINASDEPYCAVIRGIGNFTGEKDIHFYINRANYDLRGITFEDSVVTYDGKPHSLAIGGMPPEGLAIEYLNGDQTEAGTYTVTAEFKVDNNHNAPDPWTASLTIKPATLTSATAASQPYDGTVKKPVLTVKSGELTVTTYSLGSWGKEELQRVGTYTATVEGTGNFAGKVSALFTITRATATIVIDNKLKEYGEDDPEWTATVKGLFNDDSVEYESLSRAGGEEPGSYAIRAAFNEIQGNYSVGEEEGTLTIAKATPSVSEAPTATMTYGEELGDAEIRGSMKGHRGEAVDGRFQFKDPDFEPTVAESGKFAAVFIPNDIVHYQEVEIDIDVRVAKRELSVWAKDATVIYGDEPPPPDDYDYFCRGFVFGDSQSVVTGDCSYACAYEKNGSIGEYLIAVTDVSRLFASNYCFAIDQTTNGILHVGRKAVVVVAVDTGKVFGTDDPELTVTIEGRVDEADEIHYSISRQGGKNVGDYAITPTGDAEQKNYTVTYRPGTFTIVPAKITEATAVSQTYDGAVKAPALTVRAGELTATYDLGEWSPSELKAAGTYEATVTGTGNFCGELTVSFAIEKATYDMSGVTLADGTITYDGKFHALAIDGDLPDGVTVTYAGGGTDVGTYDVTATFAGDANHKPIDMRMAKLTIAPKPVTVRADRATKTYGSDDPDFTATVEGLLNGDSLKYEFERTPFGEDVSSAYAVKPVGEVRQGNYAVTYVAAGFEITKAQLVVSPVGAVVRYGDAQPAFGCTFATFARDDDESVVSGACAFRCDYEAGDAPGDYAVFVESVGGLSAANYTFVASPSPATLRVLSVEESSILNIFEHFAEINIDPMTGGWTLTLTNDVAETVELLDDLGEVILDLNGYEMTGTDGRVGEDGDPAIRIVAAGLAGAPTALTVRDSSETDGWIRGGKGGDPSGCGGAGISVPTNALSGVSVTVEDAARDRVVGGAGGDPDGLPGLAIDNPLAPSEISLDVLDADDGVEEGESILIRIDGGHHKLTSSVQLQAVYETAAASDLDLKNVKVNGAVDASFKFPYTLTWASGDVRAQMIEIPVKSQTKVKADRELTLELQNPMNAKLKGVDETFKNRSQRKVKILGGLGPVTDKFYVRAVPNDATRGKTSGSALVAAGKKVTVKATALKGYAFMGWEGLGSLEGLDSRSASISFSAPTNSVDLVARFEPLAADFLELKDDFLPAEIELGKVFSNAVTVASGSLPTITVSGLPTGLKYYAKETVVKATSRTPGYTVPANTIYGIPTKASATNKTTKAVTPSKVKVTVKNLGGYKVVRTYELRVTARTTGLAAVIADDKPYATVTVALSDDAAGKVTGAGLYQAGKKVTLKATAQKGYVFAEWLENGVNVSSNASYVIASMPSTNVSLVAKFALPDEVADPKGKGVGVAVVRNNDFAGNVTGAGYYAVGKKVTLKATALKGYVFSGWYRDAAFEDLITQDASLVIASLQEKSVRYYAVFVTAGEDLGSIETAVNGMALTPGSGKDSASPLPTNVMCGVTLQWPVVSTALSLPKVAVSGLPSGLKFTAKPVTAKVNGVTVTNVPANTIYGAPTAASSTDRATGLPKPSKVKVTVTTSGKSKAEYQIDLVVVPLPDYAVGTFDGPVFAADGTTNGVVKLTVAKSGKISGTIQTNCVNAAAKKLALSVASFAALTNGVFYLMPTYKDGKATVEVPLTLSAAAVDGGTIGAVDGESLVAYQNVLKGVAATAFEAPALGAYTNLTLTVQKDGVLKVAGKVPDNSGKLISASGSSQIYYDAKKEGYRAVIYLPSKKGFDGIAEVLEVEEEKE